MSSFNATMTVARKDVDIMLFQAKWALTVSQHSAELTSIVHHPKATLTGVLFSPRVPIWICVWSYPVLDVEHFSVVGDASHCFNILFTFLSIKMLLLAAQHGEAVALLQGHCRCYGD